MSPNAWQDNLNRRRAAREARNPPTQDPAYEKSEESYSNSSQDEDACPLPDLADTLDADLTHLSELLTEFLEELRTAPSAPQTPAKPLSDAEQAVYDLVEELLPYVTNRNEQRLLTFGAYYHLRAAGYNRTEAVKLTSIATGVSTSTLWEWRKFAELFRDVPFDARIVNGEAQERWMLGKDEDLQEALRTFVQSNTDQRGEPNVTIAQITAWINGTLLRPYIDAADPHFAPISERTANRWLKKLGFTWETKKKSGFVDGHEAEENVEGPHGRKAFVREMGNIIAHNKMVEAENARIAMESKKNKQQPVPPLGMGT